MQKKGWIRIVESFMAILLIVGVFFTIINMQNIDQKDTAQKIYKAQIAILRNIENNDDLRQDILDVDEENLPVSWDSFESNGLKNVSDRIIEKTPRYLECKAQVCNITNSCAFESEYIPDEINIYAQSVGITATTSIYNPLQLKLFCWLR